MKPRVYSSREKQNQWMNEVIFLLTEIRDAVVQAPAPAVDWEKEVEQYRTSQRGGWYTLPSGEKVQGTDSAIEKLKGEYHDIE